MKNDYLNLDRNKTIEKTKKYDSSTQGRKDHYLTQSHLRKFSINKNESKKQQKVAVYNKENSGVEEELIQNVGYKKGHDSREFEEYLRSSNLENSFPKLINSLKSKNYKLTMDEREIFFKYVILSLVRSPFFTQYCKDGLQKVYSDHARKINSSIESQAFKGYCLENLDGSTHKTKRIMLDIFGEEGRLLKHFVTDCDLRFNFSKNLILGDNPIVPREKKKKTERELYGFYDCIFYFPLSPNLVACFGPKRKLKRLKIRNKIELNDKEERILNSQQCSFASKEVYSDNKNLLENLIKNFKN